MSAAPLIDSFGRVHDNLRISVTDRCNIRCFYCMPETEVKFVPRGQILDFEEIERFARFAVGLGIRKLRITGGEPLVRRDLPVLVARLAAIPGVEDLALTTNGVLLAELAEPLYRAGLRRLNVHLDTLDRARFERITRRDDLGKVLAGLEAARRAGFSRIKLNAVAVKDLVEPDIVPLARFARENGFEARYIEFMPLDAQNLWDRDKVLLAGEIIETLSREISPLIPIPDPDPRAPASEYRYADGGAIVGFIASVSRPFCANCNRIRLTADG
ncbi:MAG: GTP 3',8-cyclase MoaA, partial [Acidobacteria bacterium]|nr:GTP 3',8-cyclase MoaA [Acidobacteriota bacterium]